MEDRKDFPKFSPFASRPGAMINPQWLELPISQTNFHGPLDARVFQVKVRTRYRCVYSISSQSWYPVVQYFFNCLILTKYTRYGTNYEEWVNFQGRQLLSKLFTSLLKMDLFLKEKIPQI